MNAFDIDNAIDRVAQDALVREPHRMTDFLPAVVSFEVLMSFEERAWRLQSWNKGLYGPSRQDLQTELGKELLDRDDDGRTWRALTPRIFSAEKTHVAQQRLRSLCGHARRKDRRTRRIVSNIDRKVALIGLYAARMRPVHLEAALGRAYDLGLIDSQSYLNVLGELWLVGAIHHAAIEWKKRARRWTRAKETGVVPLPTRKQIIEDLGPGQQLSVTEDEYLEIELAPASVIDPTFKRHVLRQIKVVGRG